MNVPATAKRHDKIETKQLVCWIQYWVLICWLPFLFGQSYGFVNHQIALKCSPIKSIWNSPFYIIRLSSKGGATLGIQTALGKGENLNDIISFLFKEIPKILVQQAFLFVTTLPFEIFYINREQVSLGFFFITIHLIHTQKWPIPLFLLLSPLPVPLLPLPSSSNKRLSAD